MVPQPLHRPFVGISLRQEDCIKARGILPTPSYSSTLQSLHASRCVLIYVIEGYISSPAQYLMISNIKLGLADYLFVPFEPVEAFYIHETTTINNIVYTIKELSRAFKASRVPYPNIYHPADASSLYRHTIWHGKRLIHQRCYTPEALTAAALLMNKKIPDPLSTKDLHKKVTAAHRWIMENREGFPVRLDPAQLKKAHTRGGATKNTNQAAQTRQAIQKLLATGSYTKPNGKPNISALAKALSLNRKTITRHLSAHNTTANVP